MKRFRMLCALLALSFIFASCSAKSDKEADTDTEDINISISDEDITEATSKSTKTAEATESSIAIAPVYKDTIMTARLHAEGVVASEEGFEAIDDIVKAKGKDYALENIGFTLMDIDDNAVEELNIAENDTENNRQNILLICTLNGNTDNVLLFSGAGNYQFAITSEMKFYYRWEEGELAYKRLGNISADGLSVVFEKNYYKAYEYMDDYAQPLDAGAKYGWFESNDGALFGDCKDYGYLGEDEPLIEYEPYLCELTSFKEYKG